MSQKAIKPNLFIDANVFLDLLLMRKEWESALFVLRHGRRNKARLIVSASSILNIYYFGQKGLDENRTTVFIEDMLTYCEVAPNTRLHIEFALQCGFNDFEDAVQYACAKEYDANVIITSDKKGFNDVKDIEIFSPKQYLGYI